MFNQSELRRRPTYNELIQEISEDYTVVFPDRRAKFLRDSPYLSYLDNETYLEVEDQQKQLGIQQQTEQTIRQEAANRANCIRTERHKHTNRNWRRLPSSRKTITNKNS